MSTPPETTPPETTADHAGTPARQPAGPAPGDAAGWYVVTGRPDALAHRSDELTGSEVRPVCTTVEPAHGDIRAPGEGDILCRACLLALRRAGLDADAPLPECLGCGALRNPDAASGAIPAHPATTAAFALPNGDCAGSLLRSAAFDGRDPIRREGVGGRAQTLRQIATRTAEFRTLLDRGWSFTVAASDHAEPIMRLDGTVRIWDKLIGSGDYLITLGIALTSITRPYEGANALEAAVRRCTAEGAKDWVSAVRWKITPMLTAAAGTTPNPLADLVDDLLSRL